MAYPDPDWLERSTERFFGWACDDHTMTEAMIRMLVPILLVMVVVGLFISWVVSWAA